jgi:hypothetical protein
MRSDNSVFKRLASESLMRVDLLLTGFSEILPLRTFSNCFSAKLFAALNAELSDSPDLLEV